VIAKTDADGVGRALGEKYGVKGYPSTFSTRPTYLEQQLICPALKWFPANSLEPVDYNGGRDLESLVAL
jgi:protein disulfide-isomerase A6